MRVVHLLPAGVVLVALGAIGGVAQLDHPAAPSQNPSSTVTRQVAVTSAARACPPALGGGSAPVALLAGPAVPAAAAGASHPGTSGQVELTALPPAGLPPHPAGPVRAQSPGVFSLLTLPAGPSTGSKGAPAAQGWSVSATGT